MKFYALRLLTVTAIILNFFVFRHYLMSAIGRFSITTYNVYVPFFLFGFLLFIALLAIILIDFVTIRKGGK